MLRLDQTLDQTSYTSQNYLQKQQSVIIDYRKQITVPDIDCRKQITSNIELQSPAVAAFSGIILSRLEQADAVVRVLLEQLFHDPVGFPLVKAGQRDVRSVHLIENGIGVFQRAQPVEHAIRFLDAMIGDEIVQQI